MQPKVALRKDSTVEEMGAEAVRTKRRLPPILAWNQKDEDLCEMTSSLEYFPVLRFFFKHKPKIIKCLLA